jgi:hypothetical protein
MMDESLPLTIREYEEWGDPHQKVKKNFLPTVPLFLHFILNKGGERGKKCSSNEGVRVCFIEVF